MAASCGTEQAVVSRVLIWKSKACLLLYSPHHVGKKTGMHIIASSMPIKAQNLPPTFPCRWSKVGTDDDTSYYFLSSLASVDIQYFKSCQQRSKVSRKDVENYKGLCIFEAEKCGLIGQSHQHWWQKHIDDVDWDRIMLNCARSACCSYGVMVSTLDFESSDPGSNPGRSWIWEPLTFCCEQYASFYLKWLWAMAYNVVVSVRQGIIVLWSKWQALMTLNPTIGRRTPWALFVVQACILPVTVHCISMKT